MLLTTIFYHVDNFCNAAGAEVNAVNKYGSTAITLAEKKGLRIFLRSSK